LTGRARFLAAGPAAAAASRRSAPAEGLGSADPLRRAVALRTSLVERRSVIMARLDSYLELLGQRWHGAFGGDLTLDTPLRFLAAEYVDPHAVRRLGKPGSPDPPGGTPAARGARTALPASWPRQPKPCSRAKPSAAIAT
jgi:hypothetical protein